MQLRSPSSLSSEPEFQRLLSRISARYSICCETLAIGGREYDFTRVLDPDRVLEQFERQTRQDESSELSWQPYWAEAWESAVVLAGELANRNLAGRSVLDLGCGLGLVGTVAASLGGEVLMVDAAPPSLLFARINSWPWREKVTVKQVDWRRDELPQTFSLIAGSDIVYDRAEWPYLERFWRRHLQDDGTVLLAEPGRSTGDEFIAWIANRGWRLQEIPHKLTVANAKRIRMLEIQPERTVASRRGG